MTQTTHIWLVFCLCFCVFGGYNSRLSFDGKADIDDDGSFLLKKAERRDLSDGEELDEDNENWDPVFYDQLRRMLEDTGFIEDDYDFKDGEDKIKINHHQDEVSKREFDPKDQDVENGEYKDVKVQSTAQQQQKQKPCHKSKMTDAYVLKIIKIIGRMIKHFKLYTNKIITDGLFALRLCEGALKNIVDDLPKSNKYWHQLNALHETIKMVNTQVYHAIMKRGDSYDLKYATILKPLSKGYLQFPKRSLSTMRHLYEKGIILYPNVILIINQHFTKH